MTNTNAPITKRAKKSTQTIKTPRINSSIPENINVYIIPFTFFEVV